MWTISIDIMDIGLIDYRMPPHLSFKPREEPPRAIALAAMFGRLVAQIQPSVNCDAATLVIQEEGNKVLTIAVSSADEPAAKVRSGDRKQYSEKLWSSGSEPIWFIQNARIELDPTFEADQQLLNSGAQSLMVVTLRASEHVQGILVVASRELGTFDRSTAELLTPISEFLSTAVEREKAWELEQSRQRRRMALEALVPTIGESLDVRKVFVALSAKIKEVIPHDVLAFALLSPDRKGVRVQAATQLGVLDLPEYRFSNDDEALDANWRFLLAYDLTPIDANSVRVRISPRNATKVEEVVVRPGPAWMRFVTQAGIHSTLRVPIRRNDKPIGGVAFMSRKPDAYDSEDGILASRITNLVALALAHQEIAQEEQRIALAEERAQLLEKRVDALAQELERFSAHRAIGVSRAWKNALALATQVASTETTVLVTGESGTGKEVIARYLHRGSKRANGPFIAINCAAISENLLESELFGHERGAFTGALEAKTGKFERAAGGLLFLDEVGEMSPAMQAKFLRVLQEREFHRVGGSKTISADVRIVAATNRDPRAEIAAGRFREDLYYRLGIFEIHLPPLRERPEDILVLAESFLEEVGRTIGRPAAGISEDAREQILAHNWPGNVRELRNAIERAVILCQGGLVTREHLPITVSRPAPERVAIAAPVAAEFPVEGIALETVERELLQKAMAKAGNNKSHAAKLLSLSRGQLYSLLRKHGLTDAKR